MIVYWWTHPQRLRTGRADRGCRGRPAGRRLRRWPGSPPLAGRGGIARGAPSSPRPSRLPVSAVVAGPGLHRLYVTTATEHWTDEQRRAGSPVPGWSTRSTPTRPGGRAAPFRSANSTWWATVIGVQPEAPWSLSQGSRPGGAGGFASGPGWSRALSCMNRKTPRRLASLARAAPTTSPTKACPIARRR